ncbi:MAG: hypothetical protein R3D45_08185 [Rhizobiaceae bacterium]
MTEETLTEETLTEETLTEETLTRSTAFNRRFVSGDPVSTVAFAGMWPVHAKRVVKEIADFKPGEFTWHP